ncbi:MAG: DHH family phosphoesterase [Firmicutes bacterium]|nr:DHH family phosphoesterase [Bacillota bacterium]
MEDKKHGDTHLPVPRIIIDEQGKVLKANEHIGEVFLYEGIVGGDIFALTGFKVTDLFGFAVTGTHPLLERNNKFFKVYAYHETENEHELALAFTDVTVLEDLKDRYNEEKPCIAKVLIDNYDELIEAQRESKDPVLSSKIERIIRDWGESLNASISRVKNNRFNIWFAQGNLEKPGFTKFEILDEVRKLETNADFPASLSIGIGVGGKTMDLTEGYADGALDLALGRGGDQVVIKRINKIEYYGGKLQTVEKSNKGKSRIVGHALTQLISQASRIFIMGHMSCDMDGFGAALGVARLCISNSKNPYIVIEKPNESLDDLFYQARSLDRYNFISRDRSMELCDRDSLIIVVDTHRPDMVQCPELLQLCDKVVVIDHHRRMEKAIENPVLSYMESYASSASELVTEILQYILPKKEMEKIEAEALLAGITVDTNSFTIRSGVRTFEAAAWLRRQGADPAEVKRFFQEDMERELLKAKGLTDATIMGNGIAITSIEGKRSDAQLLCAQLADRLLNIKAIRASFVCGMDLDRRTVISARSLGDVNVQLIMEKMGGGGHLTNAAAQVNMSVEGAIKRIMEITEETVV